MRNLARDTQVVYISRYQGIERERDAQGRLTGKNVPLMAAPEPFYPSASMARGEAQGAYFGNSLDYDKVLTLDDPSFAVTESDRLWIETDVGDLDNPNPYDYAIKRVSRKGDFTVIAAKHVEVSK